MNWKFPGLCGRSVFSQNFCKGKKNISVLLWTDPKFQGVLIYLSLFHLQCHNIYFFLYLSWVDNLFSLYLFVYLFILISPCYFVNIKIYIYKVITFRTESQFKISGLFVWIISQNICPSVPPRCCSELSSSYVMLSAYGKTCIYK